MAPYPLAGLLDANRICVFQVMVSVLPAALFKSLVVIIRTANNVVGGVSFVTCARIVGSQKSPAASSVAQEVDKKERGKK
jgi:hypothetical protein